MIKPPFQGLASNTGDFQVVLVGKNPAARTGDIKNTDLIPGSGRSSGGQHGNPLQYSCLENPMDRGAWQAAVHGVTKRQPWLKQLRTHRPLKQSPSGLGLQHMDLEYIEIFRPWYHIFFIFTILISITYIN